MNETDGFTLIELTDPRVDWLGLRAALGTTDDWLSLVL